MPLPTFTDEAQFRSQWIAPFLSKMGYILVNHVHGSGEQGKDFFFADYDQFEHRRFYAVQAKNGNIGAGDVELDKLLNQVRRCFTVKLRFHKEAEERRVSAVYIMASGSISREGREYISDWCQAQPFGENVYYLDGDTRERLDKHAFQRTDRSLRNQLIGLLNECRYNTSILSGVQCNFQQRKSIFQRCRHSALEALLNAPPPSDLVAFELLQTSWNRLALVNKLLDSQMFPIAIATDDWDVRCKIATQAWEYNLRVRDAASDAITRLDERYAISVEVVE